MAPPRLYDDRDHSRKIEPLTPILYLQVEPSKLPKQWATWNSPSLFSHLLALAVWPFLLADGLSSLELLLVFGKGKDGDTF